MRVDCQGIHQQPSSYVALYRWVGPLDMDYPMVISFPLGVFLIMD